MTDNDRRRVLLMSLIRADASWQTVAAELAQFGWDCDVELVELRAEDLKSVIERFARGQTTSGELEEWADAVEGRDDIHFAAPVIKDILAEIANPTVFGGINLARAGRWLAAIK
ncbi:MAG TPA: hypothetical protein VGH20_14845 [Myxococcales bacterium]|jgi:hypothetical protein